ncbi:calmin [Anaeramoeba ignava]|uniref:Calmin n=1 Tax=Anaeramoeba ignava TaxID=1746090 RepID=A0A9Q0LKR9_ANAIG|nr:calmin [Anaeramoeba ignava]
MGNVKFAQHTVSKEHTKKYEKQVRRSKECVLLLDETGKIYLANGRTAKMFGLRNSKVFMKQSQNFGLTPDYQPHLKTDTQTATRLLLEKAFKDGMVDNDFLCRTFKGQEFWVHSWITPINFGGKLITQAIMRKIDQPLDSQEDSVKKIAPSQRLLNAEIFSSDPEDFPETVFSDSISPQDTENSSPLNTIAKEEKKNQTFSLMIVSETDKISQTVDSLKEKIRAVDNPNIERNVIKGLNEISQIHTDVVESFQKKIEDSMTKLKAQSENYKKKYEELETHLQRRLVELESIKKNSNKLKLENANLWKSLNEISQVVENQKQQLAQFLSNQEEKKN